MGWWSVGWSGSSKDDGDSKSFSDEDWQRLNRIIGYNENTEYIPARQDMKLMRFYFEIRMKHNASRLIIDGSECLADLSCEDFCCNMKMYPEAKVFDLKLGSYKLLSPYGLLTNFYLHMACLLRFYHLVLLILPSELANSLMTEQYHCPLTYQSASVVDSLVGVFSYKPFNEQLDWSFTARASPCYIIYLKESIDQMVAFFKSSPTISQTLALETAAAVQVFTESDTPAPKITIPTKFRPDDIHETKLLLDLGHLILRIEEIWDSYTSEEQDIFLNFNLVLNDVSAFLVDGDYHWNDTSKEVNLLPVIDKCGIALKLQQIQVESSLYPSTRMAVRVPSLGFHFSPARYHRLMEIVKVFQDTDSESNSSNLAHLWQYGNDVSCMGIRKFNRPE